MRVPCEHGRYVFHVLTWKEQNYEVGPIGSCPGGREPTPEEWAAYGQKKGYLASAFEAVVTDPDEPGFYAPWLMNALMAKLRERGCYHEGEYVRRPGDGDIDPEEIVDVICAAVNAALPGEQ